MNAVTACSPKVEFKFSPVSILMPHGEGLRGEEEPSDQGKVGKQVTGLGFFDPKTFSYSKPTCGTV